MLFKKQFIKILSVGLLGIMSFQPTTLFAQDLWSSNPWGGTPNEESGAKPADKSQELTSTQKPVENKTQQETTNNETSWEAGSEETYDAIYGDGDFQYEITDWNKIEAENSKNEGNTHSQTTNNDQSKVPTTNNQGHSGNNSLSYNNVDKNTNISGDSIDWSSGVVEADDKTISIDDMVSSGTNLGDLDFLKPIENIETGTSPDFFYEEEILIEKTGKTIQYTLNPEAKYPIYKDTGAEVTKEGLVDIDRAISIVREVALSSGGNYVEDTDKVMGLVDGKLIILDTEKLVKATELEKLFYGTDVAVKTQDSREGGKYGAVEHLETEGKISILSNGQIINLTIDPVIENSNLLLPIRDIGISLGAEVKWNKTKREAIITKGSKVIILNENSNSAIINGVTKDLGFPARINPQERLVSVVELIVGEFGSIMEWDAIERVLVISPK